MSTRNDSAVSPVVAIMLMLVVTIIIAAVVSGFAGSAVSGQKKAPQALVNGKFSLAGGMEITHAGGDALATKDIVFTIRNGKTFGPNLEQSTAQLLDKKVIADTSGNTFLEYSDGAVGVPAFKSGDSLFINASSCNCDKLQPIIVPSDYATNISADGYSSYNGSKAPLWNLCFRNPNSVGRTFSLEVSDKSSGALISRSDIVIGA